MTNINNDSHSWLEFMKYSLSYSNGISSSSKEEIILNPLLYSDKIFLENMMKHKMTNGSLQVEDMLNLFIDYLENKEPIAKPLQSKDIEELAAQLAKNGKINDEY